LTKERWITVQSLKEVQFSKLTLEKKIELKSSGRPTTEFLIEKMGRKMKTACLRGNLLFLRTCMRRMTASVVVKSKSPFSAIHIFILVTVDYQHLRMQNRFGAPQNLFPRAATGHQSVRVLLIIVCTDSGNGQITKMTGYRLHDDGSVYGPDSYPTGI
jgi:hypothetical protein